MTKYVRTLLDRREEDTAKILFLLERKFPEIKGMIGEQWIERLGQEREIEVALTRVKERGWVFGSIRECMR